MSPEAQRIAIAESVSKEVFFDEGENWIMIGDGRCGLFEENSPDYLNDLNAMHEAERALNISDEQITYWKNTLEFVCNRDNTITLMATAAQRAEAYLRTIGKWEGGSDE